MEKNAALAMTIGCSVTSPFVAVMLAGAIHSETMSETVVTRRVERGDRDSFRTVLNAFFAHAGNAWPGEGPFLEFFERVVAESPGFVFLGTFEGEELLGIASVARVESSYEFRPCAYCDDVYVVPEARGRGIGQALMDHAVQVATAWGASSLLLGAGDDPEARAFYERAGFKTLSTLLVRPIEGS